MIFLIAGRTGAGKDYFTEKLIKQYSILYPNKTPLVQLKSYATRPKRTDNEDTHIFIKPEDATSYTDKIASTIIGDYEYFATASQVKNSDIYIIDPNGIDNLTKNMPDETFQIIYIYAEDDDRKMHAISRADNKISEEKIFIDRDNAENEQFSDFEKILRSDSSEKFPQNVTCVYKVPNKYDVNELDKYAKWLSVCKNRHDTMTAIVSEGANIGILNKTDDNMIIAKMQNQDIAKVTPDHFADILLGNDKWYMSFMQEFIDKSKRFTDIS